MKGKLPNELNEEHCNLVTSKFLNSHECLIYNICGNNESNFAQLFRQQFKRFSDEYQLPSRYLNPASRPTHDNPMD